MTNYLCCTDNVRRENCVELNNKPENLIEAPFEFSRLR